MDIVLTSMGRAFVMCPVLENKQRLKIQAVPFWAPQCGSGGLVKNQCLSRVTWAVKDAGASIGNQQKSLSMRGGEGDLEQKDQQA